MNEQLKKIQVTHVNIRLSISFLLLKLVMIELFSGSVIVLWHFGLTFYIRTIVLLQHVINYGMPVLILLVFFKTCITTYIILQWLNEYYEISSIMIKYRRGIIFRRVDDYPTADIKFIDVNQGAFGRLLNFGTITLLNVRRVQYAQMYLIHNPLRYAQVIEDIVPGLVERKRLIRRHIHEEGEDAEEEIS